MSLPTPVGRQKDGLYLPAKGHFAVLGTAGSGKTTLAILRSAYLSDPGTENSGRTLLVTFNRALVAYLKHLEDRSLRNVTVENYHKFARGYLFSRGRLTNNAICGPDLREELICMAVKERMARDGRHPIFERGTAFFCEEIRWMEQHGIQTLETYRGVKRLGRGGVWLDPISREIVFHVFKSYVSHRASTGKTCDWDDIATAVSEAFDSDAPPRMYRHVVIDEGQDFSPEMIRSLAKAIPPDGSLTFFGDMAQQIYGRRMSWKSAGLKIGKVWEFKENYRNTKQIAKLGLAISRMPYFKDIPDLVEPVAPKADGPVPALVECPSVQDQVDLVVRQATQASRTQTVAILFRGRQYERLIVGHFSKAVRLHRDMTTWQAGPKIYYGTFHSSKGLEFDTVILPFLSSSDIPAPDQVQAFGEEEARTQDGKLLYVGVTRTKTRLIMTYTGDVTPLLPIEAGLYQKLSA